VQSYVTSLSGLDFIVLERLYLDMEKRGRDLLAAAGVEGEITLTRSADMRYLHQGFEIRVPLPPGQLTNEDLPALRRAFAEEYERLYKRLNPGVEIEVVNWRLVASGPQPQIVLRTPESTGRSLTSARKGERPVYMPEQNGFTPCPVYDRYLLPVGVTFSGPAVVEERECTVVIGPGAKASVDEEQSLVIAL
jgi:N-methylhydantoinase A